RAPTVPAPMAPLQGVRVIDFTSNMAGPFGAMILAQLGADVIKVESPGGDDARLWPPFIDGASATHRHMSAGKRGIVIDLKQPQGVAVAQRLIAGADVVLQSMRPGVADRIGIGREQALARNADILFYDLNAFGDGPAGAAMPGYDPLVQAYTGIMEMTGHDGGAPTRCAPSIIDLASGQWIAMGVLAALMAASRGQRVGTMQTALVDTAFSTVPYQAMGARLSGQRPARAGSGNTIAAPYQCFTARDAWVLIAAPSDKLWHALLDAIGAPELADDPLFITNGDRVRHMRELESRLNAILAARDAADWLPLLARAGVPATRVYGLEQAVVGEIAAERRTFLPAGGVDMVRLPWLIDGQVLPWQRPAPLLGEHSIDILRELGYADADIGELLASRAVQAYAAPDAGSSAAAPAAATAT
ncbi:MAG: CaiB/BaiF CoA transferase family protein, partial [Lautropia sp.]